MQNSEKEWWRRKKYNKLKAKHVLKCCGVDDDALYNRVNGNISW